MDNKTKIVKMGPVSDFYTLHKIEKEIFDILKEVLSKKEISQETFNEIKPIGSIKLKRFAKIA